MQKKSSATYAVLKINLYWFYYLFHICKPNTAGLVQDCSISSALAMEILQLCTKPSM